MNVNIMKSTAAFVFAASALAGCAGFEEMNKNKNAIQNTTATTFVQPTVFNYEYRMINRSFSMTSQLMQYTVGHQQNADKISNYRIMNSVTAGYWNDFYTVGGNAQAMLEQARKDKNDAAVAIAEILKVLAISTITDAYGDVPYFEALQGYTSGGTEFTPRYDKQKEIYRDLFRLLEDANTLLANSKNNFDPTEDYMYEGDIKKWRKFGNSLYLRLLMRVALKDDIDVATESLYAVSKLNEIFSYPADYPVFESREDAADVPFDDTVTAMQTPFFSWRAGSWNSNMICERLMNEMYDPDADLSDPRLNFYFDNKRVGAPTQVTYQELVPYVDIVAHYNRGLLQNRDHYPIMSLSEIYFIYAEAAHRKWISGTPKSYYDRAITESIYEWNPDASASTVSSFLNHPNVTLDGLRDEAALERIMTQKWISTVLVGIESWCDFRRTGYPEMPVKSLAGNDGILPTRLLYPADEEFRNPDNYKEAVNDWLGGVNNMKTNVWWADHNQKRVK
ncbi:MAG: SusD/RagB family nutrient-binding outer membrane lipoprotein [Alistipes sp.]|nr:SusD/RagB family nutrient-binding outer membrane lipoprotein [Alistipes sp.]